jgi:hypothetical protein
MADAFQDAARFDLQVSGVDVTGHPATSQYLDLL